MKAELFSTHLMKQSIQSLEIRLQELEEAIAETEKRLPAHSVKPPVMEDLFRLEDERAELLQRISLLKDSG